MIPLELDAPIENVKPLTVTKFVADPNRFSAPSPVTVIIVLSTQDRLFDAGLPVPVQIVAPVSVKALPEIVTAEAAQVAEPADTLMVSLETALLIQICMLAESGVVVQVGLDPIQVACAEGASSKISQSQSSFIELEAKFPLRQTSNCRNRSLRRSS